MNAPILLDFPRAHDGEAGRLAPGRLWSLWDMLEENAVTFMELGKQLYDITAVFDSDSYSPIDKKTGVRRLVPEAVDDVQQQLRALLKIARKLNLPASIGVLERQVQFVDTCPQTEREIELIRNIFESEIGARKCLFIPSHLEKYYEFDELLSEQAKDAFPSAYEELVAAGNCLATSAHTACVFHSMRAAEIGLRVFGAELGAKVKGKIEDAEWSHIINGISEAIRSLENLPKQTEGRSDDLQFFSEAAVQFKCFKNAWRVRAAHARANYNESQAKEVLDHVRSFFETLSTRLRE
jgi:hypothetical protein